MLTAAAERNELDHKHVFFDRIHKRMVRRILPGEFLALAQSRDMSSNGPKKNQSAPSLMMTVLGSCVTVCLTDVQAKIAGMNHFMLPNVGASCADNPQLDVLNPSARYGVNAMELLINQMMHLGAERDRLKAWIFGGAKVLSTMSNIGKSNVNFALQYLKTERIDISAQDTGGELPRKLYLDPRICIPACFSIEKVTSMFDKDERAYVAKVKEKATSPAIDFSLFTSPTK
jgi:chemotaxis protein CheD